MEYAHHHLKMKNLLSIQIFYGKKLNSMDLLGDLNSVEGYGDNFGYFHT